MLCEADFGAWNIIHVPNIWIWMILKVMDLRVQIESR